jgi:hypothetical protein
MAITIEIPVQIEQQLQGNWPNLERHALEGFVTEAFRQGKLSSHQVGQALGMTSRWQAIEFLSERGVYPGYDVDDLEQDRRTLDRIGSKC